MSLNEEHPCPFCGRITFSPPGFLCTRCRNEAAEPYEE